MAKIAFGVRGLKKLQKALKDDATMALVKQIVKKNTADLQRTAQAKTSEAYTAGYATGATKRSIQLEIDDDQLSGRVGMGMEYDPYLELGTRFMAARPVLKPSFDNQAEKFGEEIKKVMK